MLLGTDQNGARSANSLKVRVTSPIDRRGIGGAYVSRVTCRERGKPVWLPVQYDWQADRKERC
jgi:hypothetical protein